MNILREPLHVTDDGEVPFRAPVAGVDPVDAQHLVTKAWAEANLGGGGGLSDGDKGDITVGSSGTTLTIDANAVTDTKLRDSAALSVVGRSANSSGDPADIAATAASGAVLRESGSTIGFGTVATAGIADNAITNAKLRDSSALSVVGRSTNSSGDPADIAATAASGAVLRESGSTIAFGTVATAGIADNAVSNAKIRDSAALSVIGRSANSTGDPADIAAASDHQVLRRSGTAIAFGAVNLAQSAAVTGALPVANGGTGATSAAAALASLGGADAVHNHDDRDIEIDTSGATGALAGSGISTLQDLVDWLDANLTPP